MPSIPKRENANNVGNGIRYLVTNQSCDSRFGLKRIFKAGKYLDLLIVSIDIFS